MPLTQGEIVTVLNKEGGGWWLVNKNGAEGWAPADYLEAVPEAAAKPPPPAPPAKPSVAAKPEKQTWAPADSNSAPVAVMPGMGDPGGFAAVLARRKAQAAAEQGEQGEQ